MSSNTFVCCTFSPSSPSWRFRSGAFVRYLDASGKSRYLCTGTLLLTLPTPDFTMPFNVIMLTSMSLTVFYGQFYNLLFRLFYLADPKQPHTPLGRLKRFFLTRILRRKA